MSGNTKAITRPWAVPAVLYTHRVPFELTPCCRLADTLLSQRDLPRQWPLIMSCNYIPRLIEEQGEIFCGFRLDGFSCAHDRKRTVEGRGFDMRMKTRPYNVDMTRCNDIVLYAAVSGKSAIYY